MSSTPPPIQSQAFNQLGNLTRMLHEALRELGYDRSLAKVREEIPDARDRLVYVSKLTEEAANKVLAAVEKGQPECEALHARGRELAQTLRRRSQADITPVMARAMMSQCADYADRAANFGQAQSELLTDIMMSQSFQDLSGQVIKKVVDIISRTEAQLLEILVVTANEENESEAHGHHKLEGPQVPDKALKQDDVDDLLASLGF